MIDPFKIEGPACISFSGGRTSAYMLWRIIQAHGGRLPPDVVVAFANTGKEKEQTLKFVLDCSMQWGVTIVWLEYLSRAADGFRITSYMNAERKGEPFDRLIEQKQRLPNAVERACTEELKVKTIQRYLNSIGLQDPDMVVGVRYDEQRRVPKLRANGRLLPLVEARVAKRDVHAFWRAAPFDLDLPYEDGHGNCDLCFLKGGGIVMQRIFEEPPRAVWWAAKEEMTGGRFCKDRPNYATMKRAADAQLSLELSGDSIDYFCGD